MPATLGEDELLHIFKLLRNPPPAPHAEERCGASAINQSALFAVLRVSKMWYNLSAPILYEIVICASFPLLLAGINNTAIPGITPKAELLAMTTRLAINYEHIAPDVGSTPDTTGRWSWEMLKPTNGSRLERLLYGYGEARRLWGQWESAGDRRHIFRRLRYLSIGAFGGSNPDDRWVQARHQEDWAELREQIRDQLFCFLVIHSSTLEHYCEVGDGPLSLQSYAKRIHLAFPPNTPRPILTFHRFLHALYPQDRLFVPIGIQARHYFHRPASESRRSDAIVEDWATSRVSRGVKDTLKARVALAYNDDVKEEATDWTLSNTFYLPACTGPPTSNRSAWEEARVQELRAQLRRRMKRINDDLPEWCERKDRMEVERMSPQTVCEACEWTGAA